MCVRKEVHAIQAAKRAEEEHRDEGGQAIFARRVCHRSQLQSFSTRCRSDNAPRSCVISCPTYKLSSQIGTKTTTAPQRRPSCWLALHHTLFSIIFVRHPNSGGAYSNDGLRGQSGDNEEARGRNRLESIVWMHELTWKRGITKQQQNKDASKVFGGDHHDWEEEEKEEKKKKNKQEGRRSATTYNKEDDGNMLSLLLLELRAQFLGMGNNALFILPGKRRKKSNGNKNAKMAPFARCFGGPD